MDMKKLLVGLLFMTALVAQGASAGFSYNLKLKNPDVLPRYVLAGADCPFTILEAREVVDGVLIRSRVKPASYAVASLDEYYLGADVTCYKLGSKHYGLVRLSIENKRLE